MAPSMGWWNIGSVEPFDGAMDGIVNVGGKYTRRVDEILTIKAEWVDKINGREWKSGFTEPANEKRELPMKTIHKELQTQGARPYLI